MRSFDDSPQPTPIDTQQPPATELPPNYDYLFDPSYEGGSVEEAAVWPDKPQTVAPTPAERAQIDVELRTRTPQGKLTAAQIGQMAVDRGGWPTPEQIEGINKARARGGHYSGF